MRPSSRTLARRWLTALGASLALAGCQNASRAPVLEPVGDVCQQLANVFYLVAYNRDAGQSERTQLERMRASMDSPFVSHPERTYAHVRHVVDLVYRDERATPVQIRDRVRAQCVVNERGHASLRSLWPTP